MTAVYSERGARIEKLAEFVKAMLEHLPGWSWLDNRSDDGWAEEVWATAGGPNGAELSIHADWHKKRIHVSGVYPTSEGGYTFGRPRHGTDAYISLDRDPKKAAADLSRRVIVPYLEEYAKGLAAKKEHDDAVNDKAAFGKSISERYLDREYRHDRNGNVCGYLMGTDLYVEADIGSDDKVGLSLRHVSREKLVKILELLAR